MDGDNYIYVWPIEDIDNLNSLRESVELSPFEEYVKIMEQTYSLKVIFDPDLDIDSFNASFH